jgi:hypothetical protein
MPKHSRGKKSQRNLRQSYSISGKQVVGLTVTNGNTASLSALSPLTFSGSVPFRLATAFKYFRFKRVSLHIPPIVRFETTVPTTSLAGLWCMAYVPEANGLTTSTTYVNACSIPDNIIGTAQIVNSNVSNNSTLSTGWPGTLMVAGDTESKRFTIRSGALNEGVLRKYECKSDSQGTIILAVSDPAGGNTVVTQIVMSYTIEFSEPFVDDLLGSALPPLTDGKSSDAEYDATRSLDAYDVKEDCEWIRHPSRAESTAPPHTPRPPGVDTRSNMGTRSVSSQAPSSLKRL